MNETEFNEKPYAFPLMLTMFTVVCVILLLPFILLG